MPNKFKNYLNTETNRFQLAFLCFLIACITYSGIVWNDFTYDDYLVIVNNPYIDSRDFILQCFSKGYFNVSGEATYRPVVTWLYWFVIALFGKQAIFFHILSLCLHALTTAGIVLLGYSMGLGSFAVLSGIFFAVHPILTEAVCSIAFLEDVLITFFSIIGVTLITSIRNTDSRRKIFLIHFFTAICFVLAVFSKESGIALAILLPAGIVFRKIKNKTLSDSETKIFLRQQIFYIVAWMLPIVLLYLVVRFYLLSGYATFPDWLGGSFVKACLSACVIAIEYLGRLIYPVSLSLIRTPINIYGFTDPIVIIALLLHILLIFSCLITFRNVPVWSLGIIWFYVSFAPVSNMVPFWNPVADRYLYMMAPGFVFALSSLLNELWRYSKTGRIVALSITVIILSMWIESTMRRVNDWQNNQTLWKKELMLHPANSLVLVENAAVANQNGNYEEAMELASKALTIDPSYDSAHYYIGKSLMIRKRYDEAFQHYRKALSSRKLQKHLYCDALFDMAYMADKVYGDLKLAESIYKNALAMDPAYLRASFNLGELLFRQHKYDDALQIWQMALKFYPSHPDLIHNLKLTERMLQNNTKR